jgi:hypothetical protein
MHSRLEKELPPWPRADDGGVGPKRDLDTPLLVNVLGLGRSGTTMLGLMLGNCDHGFACGEAHHWFRPRGQGGFAPKCQCGRRPCEYWAALADFPAAGFHRRVADRLGVGVVSDSSKTLDWARDSLRWARETQMRSVSLVTWKEPLDQIYSWWRRGQLSTETSRRPTGGELAKRARGPMRRYVRYHHAALSGPFHSIAVPCAELVDRPQARLEGLCAALGVPYVEGQERYWTKEHHACNGSPTTIATAASSNPRLHREPLPTEFREAAAELADAVARNSEIEKTVTRLRGASLPAPHAGGIPVR